MSFDLSDVVGVACKPKRKALKAVPMMFYLDKGMRRQIEAYSNREEITLSEAVRRLVSKGLDYV